MIGFRDMIIRFIFLHSIFLFISSNAFSEQLLLTKNQQQNVVIVKPKSTTSSLEFHPFAQRSGTGEIKLANGEVADKVHWQGLLVAKFETDDDSHGYCTASLIGPNVILTAAHCIETDEGNLETSVQIKMNKIGMSCSMHPSYANSAPSIGLRSDEDYALCLLDKEIDDIAYETVDLSSDIVTGSNVVMTGYGCINVRIEPNGELGYDESEDVLRIGAESVSKVATSPITFGEGSMFYTMSPANTEPTLCPGDSGGPVFKLSLSSNLQEAVNRRIVGINSAVAWYRADINNEADFYSYFAPLNHLSFVNFLGQWRDQHPDALVCGLGDYAAGTLGCRE